MPKYSYKCVIDSCKNHDQKFEVRQRITEEPLKECPLCGGAVFRVIGKTSYIGCDGFHGRKQ